MKFTKQIFPALTPTIYLPIDGFSSIEEQGELFKAIIPRVYSGKKLLIAEVGVYKGRMTAMFCELLSLAAIETDYYCIDHFMGSAEHEHRDYFPDFCKTYDLLRDLPGVRIRAEAYNSIKASEAFPDGSLDIVYLNASHDYKSVMAYIAAWIPKVRKGGIICGDDYTPGLPGVIKAVDESFSGQEVIKIASQQWMIQL